MALNKLTGLEEPDDQTGSTPVYPGMQSIPAPGGPQDAAAFNQPPRAPMVPPAAPPPPQPQPGLTAPTPPTATAPPAGLPQPQPGGLTPVSSVTDTDRSRSGVIQSAAEKATLGKLDKTDDEQKALEVRKTALEQKASAQTADAAQAEAAQAAQKQAQINQVIADHERDYKAALATKQQEYEKYKGMDLKDFWQDKSTANRVGAGIAIALGQYSASMNGGPNAALSIINDAISRDADRQKAAIAKQRDVYQQAGANADQIQLAKEHALADIGLKAAAATDVVTKQLKAGLAKQGMDADQINGDQRVLGLEKAKQERLFAVESQLREHYVNTTRNQVQKVLVPPGGAMGAMGAGGMPLVDKPSDKWTADERKSEGVVNRMIKSEREMDKYKYSKSDMNQLEYYQRAGTGFAGTVLKGVHGSLYKNLSPEGKKLYNAQGDFIAARLRQESGAAIGIQERMDFMNQYGYQPGDTPEQQAQRKAQRGELIYGAAMETGRPSYWSSQLGRDKVGNITQPSAPVATGQERIGTVDGRRYRGVIDASGQFRATEAL